MAELLVHAKGHWMDDMTQDEIDKLDKSSKRSRDARSQMGDIIVVKEDGWQWGREECLPNYVVVKIPGVPVEDVAHLTQPLMEDDPDKPGEKCLKKKRKWQVPKGIIESYINSNTNSAVRDSGLLNILIEKQG